MKQIIIFITAFIIFMSINAKAQVKPAQSQYITEKGALINPGFEQGKKGWTLVAGTFAFGSTALLDKHASVSVSSQVLDFSNFTTDLTPFAGKQGLAYCKVNTSVSGMSFQVLDNAGVVSQLDIIGDGSWKFLEIPFVIDAALNAVKILSDSATIATVAVEDCDLGLAPKGYIQTVGDNLRDSTPYTPTLINFGNGTSSLSYYRLGDKMVIEGQLIVGSTLPTGQFGWTLPSGFSADYSANPVGVTGIDGFQPSGTCSSFTPVQYNALTLRNNTSLTDFYCYGDNNLYTNNGAWNATAPLTWVVGDTISIHQTVKIQGWVAQSASVVMQGSELTARTSNEFTGAIASNQVTKSKENFNIMTCTSGGVGVGNCVFTDTTLFSSAPSVQITLSGGEGACRIIREHSITNLGFSYNTFSISNVLTDCAIDFEITRGVDYIKSVTLAGSFEQIEEVDATLDEFSANELTARITGAGAITSQKYDWITGVSGAAGDYNITVKTGVFTVLPACFVTGYWSGGVKSGSIVNSGLTLTNVRASTQAVATGALIASDFTVHCSKQGVDVNTNLKGVVVNASKSATKCQTKYLQASVSSTGTVSDLGFSNLDITKFHSLALHTSFVYNTLNTCTASYSDGTNTIVRVINREANGPSDRTADVSTAIFFKPVSSTLTATMNENTACVLEGNGTSLQTYATLCELPNTYVETTEH